MKFEFEISDSLINEMVCKDVAKITDTTYGRRSELSHYIGESVEKVVKTRVEEVMQSEEIITMIDEVIKVRADQALPEISDQKVPGWVSRNIKEMLKYAKYRFLDEANSQ